MKSEDESHVEWKCMHVMELHFCLLLSATHPMHRQGSRQMILTLTAPALACHALLARRVVHGLHAEVRGSTLHSMQRGVCGLTCRVPQCMSPRPVTFHQSGSQRKNRSVVSIKPTRHSVCSLWLWVVNVSRWPGYDSGPHCNDKARDALLKTKMIIQRRFN